MTTTLRHHSPLGAIAITGVRGVVEPDTDFELPDHLAARLLEQDDIYELVSGDPREREDQTVSQLRHDLAERGLPYKQGKKDELLERAIESDKVAPAPLVGTAAEAAPVPEPAPEDAGEPTPDTDPATETPATAPAPEDAGEPVDVVTDEPTTTEPATGQEGA